MCRHEEELFNHELIAFDIDGVVADTMSLFVQLAHERYGLTHLKKEQMVCYDLYRCLGLPREVIDDLICLTLSDEHTLKIPPMPMAPAVLTEFARYGPLRFITARIWPESIIQWLHYILPHVAQDRIQVIATGAPEAKLEVLRGLGIKIFVEDRLETCEFLALDGIQPLLFDQPWNRLAANEKFPRFHSWLELRNWILGQNGRWSSE